MRIIFMGTPDFAVPALQRLIDRKDQICGVFTQPDKPKGRGHKMQFSPVKELALQYGLSVYQPDSLRDESVQSKIQQLGADIIVVVAYGKILPKSILDAPALGCINVHGSLLPRYRGAAPIQWMVINGENRRNNHDAFGRRSGGFWGHIINSGNRNWARGNSGGAF